MADRVLARILLRVAGLLLLASGVPGFLMYLTVFVQAFVPATASPFTSTPGYVIQMAIYSLAQLLQCVLALYLLFRGKWAVSLCTRGLSGCCFDCGYDLAGHTKDTCPECGAAIPPSQRAALHAAAGKPAVDGGGLESPPP